MQVSIDYRVQFLPAQCDSRCVAAIYSPAAGNYWQPNFAPLTSPQSGPTAQNKQDKSFAVALSIGIIPELFFGELPDDGIEAPMILPAPHFLLYSESSGGRKIGRGSFGRWRFVLEPIESGETFEASDIEPETLGERLELLAVVRGLEALHQPSRVTLVTRSKYVSRGVRNGLPDWRENGWQWERFGRLAPVKNRDLWQRVDQALQYHSLECRSWRFDSASVDEKNSSAPAAPAFRHLRNRRRKGLQALGAAGQRVGRQREQAAAAGV